jgi:peptidoglycan/xylan/chitin deacetylase (PgdA/CDA1 family)
VEQLRAMAAAGIEIGVHGYSHADLGEIYEERQLRREVVTSGEQLQDLLGRPMRYFAFPYGQHVNLNSHAFQLAHEAGYEAICSAYGGYNFPGDDAFHLQRIHADRVMIRLKNRVTVDPRKLSQYRFQYDVALDARQVVGNRQ